MTSFKVLLSHVNGGTGEKLEKSKERQPRFQTGNQIHECEKEVMVTKNGRLVKPPINSLHPDQRK
jgi:hypothetical protein